MPLLVSQWVFILGQLTSNTRLLFNSDTTRLVNAGEVWVRLVEAGLVWAGLICQLTGTLHIIWVLFIQFIFSSFPNCMYLVACQIPWCGCSGAWCLKLLAVHLFGDVFRFYLFVYLFYSFIIIGSNTQNEKRLKILFLRSEGQIKSLKTVKKGPTHDRNQIERLLCCPPESV